MKSKRHGEEQIVYALLQGESCTQVKEIRRQVGVTEASYYTWNKKCAGMGMTELQQMKKMEEEIRHLDRLVADLSLDKQMLQDVIIKGL